MRLDRELGIGDFTLQGDYTRGDFGDAPLMVDSSLALSSHAANVAARWGAQIDSGRFEISSYYSSTDRGRPNRWSERSFGVDTQYSAERIGRHQITAGIDYRFAGDRLGDPSMMLNLVDSEVSQHQWGLYAQDEIHFFDDAVRIVLGGKLEDLEFTGLAFQPTVRSLWHVNKAHTIWAAASRAVRTPSRIELHSRMTTFDSSSPQGLVGLRINGNENLRAEDLRAYELGWRWRPLQRVSFDAALYRHDYDHLIGGTGGVPTFELLPIPALYVDLLFVNLQSARVDGAEAVVEWAAAPWARFEAQGNWIQTQVDGSPTGPVDPEESYSLRAQFDLADDVELDLSWRSIGRLTGMGPTIPSYDSLDLRVAWRMMPNIELSVSVANALDNEHVEFTQDLALAPGVSIGRTAFARLVWTPAR
jgi:iron complex outermembrane receptor protein